MFPSPPLHGTRCEPHRCPQSVGQAIGIVLHAAGHLYEQAYKFQLTIMQMILPTRSSNKTQRPITQSIQGRRAALVNFKVNANGKHFKHTPKRLKSQANYIKLLISIWSTLESAKRHRQSTATCKLLLYNCYGQAMAAHAKIICKSKEINSNAAHEPVVMPHKLVPVPEASASIRYGMQMQPDRSLTDCQLTNMCIDNMSQ